MKRLISALNPVLAGIAVAVILSAIHWQQVGAVYSTIYLDSDSRLIYLFLGHLVPGLIAIAVVTGLVSGVVDNVGGFKSAPAHGTAAAVSFGAIMFPIYMIFSPHTPRVTDSVATPMSFILSVMLIILITVVLAALGAIGSMPYAAIAAVSASLGNFLRHRSKRLLILTVSFACCTALGIAITQGASLRAELQVFTHAATKAEPLVRQHLVNLPIDYKWRPPDIHFPPKTLLVRCSIPNGIVNVDFDANGKMKSAAVLLTTPKGMELKTKKSVSTFLRKHGVREELILNLKQDKRGGMWEGDSGNYSVLVNRWYPPVD